MIIEINNNVVEYCNFFAKHFHNSIYDWRLSVDTR